MMRTLFVGAAANASDTRAKTNRNAMMITFKTRFAWSE
jgi:hypothetical protein